MQKKHFFKFFHIFCKNKKIFKKKKRKEPIIETHTSSSADIEYTTKYYPDSGNYYCTCPGTWRAKDRRCKHIKALEEKIKK